MIEFVSSSQAPPSSEQEIAALTRLIKLDVPNFHLGPEFESFLLVAEPGVPCRRHFRIAGKGAPPIDRFLNLAPPSEAGNRHARYNINVVLDSVEDLLPSGVVPFAWLANGDLLCVSSSSQGYVEVVMAVLQGSGTTASIVPVSPSFSAFLESLD